MWQAAVGNVEDGEGGALVCLRADWRRSQRQADLKEEGISQEADVHARPKATERVWDATHMATAFVGWVRVLRRPQVLARLNTSASLKAW